jgi:hypothetical protein
MGLIIGPTPWWQSDLVEEISEGGVLPDGSRIICKSGGTAWIVAPACTQVSSAWNGSTNTQVGDQCCVSSWATLCTRLISCGFNPCDWFVPSHTQLQNPGYVCRTNWDSIFGNGYWSSTEINVCAAFCVNLPVNGGASACSKVCGFCVRAFRCVTY